MGALAWRSASIPSLAATERKEPPFYAPVASRHPGRRHAELCAAQCGRILAFCCRIPAERRFGSLGGLPRWPTRLRCRRRTAPRALDTLPAPSLAIDAGNRCRPGTSRKAPQRQPGRNWRSEACRPCYAHPVGSTSGDVHACSIGICRSRSTPTSVSASEATDSSAASVVAKWRPATVNLVRESASLLFV
jgi:hypothetical protein